MNFPLTQQLTRSTPMTGVLGVAIQITSKDEDVIAFKLSRSWNFLECKACRTRIGGYLTITYAEVESSKRKTKRRKSLLSPRLLPATWQSH